MEKKKGGLRAARPNQTRSLDYETMTTPDVFALLDAEIFPLAAPIHNVWLWTIDQFLKPSEEEMLSRGYRLHARMIWDKTNGVAPAFTVRYSHEYLLWYYKPKMITICPTQRGKFRTVFQEPARQHSRKPDTAYGMIDSLYPSDSKLDVFSREKRANWEQWGNQTEHFTS